VNRRACYSFSDSAVRIERSTFGPNGSVEVAENREFVTDTAARPGPALDDSSAALSEPAASR
jgi:hypothetical protein